MASSERDRLLEAAAQSRALLGTSLFSANANDHDHRLVFDETYTPWTRSWTSLGEGYHEAARVLLERLLTDNWPFDFQVGPIIHTYRLAVELSLKRLALRIGIAPRASGHELGKLWREISAELGGGRFEVSAVTDRIAELEDLDERSTTFRYPDGPPPSRDSFTLGMTNLGEVLDALIDWVDGEYTRIVEHENFQR